MIEYSQTASYTIDGPEGKIHGFMDVKPENLDEKTVKSFGAEWEKFSRFSASEINAIGNEYFDIVPESAYGKDKVALDMGCGSGRWSLYAAQKFGFVEAIDPSGAVLVAQQNCKQKAVRISQAGADNIPFPNNAFDFVFSLGVLHHIPDTNAALQRCVEKLKQNGYCLIYLYYDLDNRGTIYKLIFSLVNALRKIIYRLPEGLKKGVSELIAAFIYLPLVLFSALLKSIGIPFWKKIPLSYYVGKSYFVIRNDALDRFGTPLEQRFSKEDIREMMKNAGLVNIQFSENQPYWHAIGKKA